MLADDPDQDDIRNKKDRRRSEYFDILINNKKVRILNYRWKDYHSPLEQGRVIELISQQKLDKADEGEVLIKINTPEGEISIGGVWKYAWSGPGNYGVAYLVKDKGRNPSASKP